jgi:hypothetical protein
LNQLPSEPPHALNDLLDHPLVKLVVSDISQLLEPSGPFPVGGNDHVEAILLRHATTPFLTHSDGHQLEGARAECRPSINPKRTEDMARKKTTRKKIEPRLVWATGTVSVEIEYEFTITDPKYKLADLDDDISAGRVVIEVGFDPLKPEEAALVFIPDDLDAGSCQIGMVGALCDLDLFDLVNADLSW